jgi:hypothetical protein
VRFFITTQDELFEVHESQHIMLKKRLSRGNYVKDSMEKAMLMKPALIAESPENKFQVWYKTNATTPEENKAAWSARCSPMGP